jgi:hypothetical protein
MQLYDVYAFYSHIVAHQNDGDSAFKFKINADWLQEQITSQVKSTSPPSSPPTATTPNSPAGAPNADEMDTGLDQKELGDSGGNLSEIEEAGHDDEMDKPAVEIETAAGGPTEYVVRAVNSISYQPYLLQETCQHIGY